MGGCASRPKVLESSQNPFPAQDSVTPKTIDTIPQENNVEATIDTPELAKEEEAAPEEEEKKSAIEGEKVNHKSEVEEVESVAVEQETEVATTEDVLVVNSTEPETKVSTTEDVLVVNSNEDKIDAPHVDTV